MSEVRDDISSVRKIFFGTGSLISVFECFFVVLFFPYVSMLGFPPQVLLPVCFAAVVVPISAMPLIYELINGSTLISVGRYHIPLALSSLGLAVFSALLFNISPEWGYGGRVTALLFSLMFSVLFLLVNKYVRASMEARICKNGDRLMRIIRNVFFTVGAAGFILGYAFIYDGSLSSVSDFSYVAAITVAISGACAYFSTQSSMPLFIRVEPPRKRNVKTIYKRFFGLFSSRDGRRVYIAYYLAMTALLIFAMSIESMTEAFSISKLYSSSEFLCFALSFLAAACLFGEFISGAYKKFYIGAGVASVACFTVVIAAYFADFGNAGRISVEYAVAVLLGVSCAVISVGGAVKMSGAARSSSSSKGVVNNLKNMTVLLAVFTSLAVVSLTSISHSYGTVIALSLASAALVASVAVFAVKDKEYLTLEFPPVYD